MKGDKIVSNPQAFEDSKKSTSKLFVAVGILVMALSLAFALHIYFGSTAEFQPPSVSTSENQHVPTNIQAPSVSAHGRRRGFSKRAGDFTEEEKMQLAKVFDERFKPAVAKWCKAYAGRISFQPEDVTLDKFNSLLGYNMYNFMVNGDTLTIVDAKDRAKVCYMSHKGTLRMLNSIPGNGTSPDLSVPVNRDQILTMVKADTGVEYKPSQVEISPTAAASAMAGGAFVNVARIMINGGELITGTNISMVFGPNGQLVQYEGPVF